MPRSHRVPILTYHPINVLGNSYELNDHVAFAADLELISKKGFRVCPLMEVVKAIEADELWKLSRCVAITFDDGSDFDFHDLPHPTWGVQRSMFALLQKAGTRGNQPTLEATSFVVISPEARKELDSSCMIGRRWWNDDWWVLAETSGLLRIESHSFDHNHESLSKTVAHAPHGAFDLSSFDEANAEIASANEYLIERRGRVGPVLFAYPYGQASAFLADEYFPRGVNYHGVRAAFTTDGVPVACGVDRWRIPRFVFGWHWKSSGELEAILDECD